MPDTLDLRHLIKQCSECGQQFSPEGVFCPYDGSRLEAVIRPPLPADPLLGQTLDGRYVIESVLGEGGMGTVYAARHATLNRPFAVKVLRADLAQESELGERFLQEAQATAAIKHPNIVSITDFGRLPDGRPYFVMERLEGRTLASLMKAGGALPPRAAARVAIEIASGLAAAHSAGVVHRDLKPENVFLVGPPGAETTQLRVVDFGAAIVLGKSRLTKKGIVFGTPYYMSPEQAAGHAVDRRTDIYALGIILYEMVAGRVPFEGETYMGVLTQHMFVAPTPPSQLSPHLGDQLGPLEAVILHTLEKEPSARYATMKELADAITDALAQVGSRGPSWPAPASPSQRAPAGIADELELPSLAELRSSVERVSHTPDRGSRTLLLGVVVAVVVLACGVVVALALSMRVKSPPPPPAPPSTTPTVAMTPSSPAATPAGPSSSAPQTVPAPSATASEDATATIRPSATSTHRPKPPPGGHAATGTPELGPDPFLRH